MYGRRFIQLVLLALCVAYVVDAANLDNMKVPRRVLAVRQTPASSPETVESKSPDKASSSPSDDDESDATSAAAPAPTKPTASAPEKTSAVQDEVTSAASSPSNEQSAQTSVVVEETKVVTSAAEKTVTSAASEADDTEETSAAEASTTAAPDDSKDDDDTKSDKDKDKDEDESRKPITSTSITVVTMTNDDGSKSTMTTTTKTTSTPGLNSEDDGGETGMPVKTRNTVIGVVVGIGGAIILGALGLVAWRIWGRKKHAEEADGLMAFGDDTSYHGGRNSYPDASYPGSYNAMEKSEPPSTGSDSANTGRSPFQNNDAYHAPAQGTVNASSNF